MRGRGQLPQGEGLILSPRQRGSRGREPQGRPARGLLDRTWAPGLTWSRAGPQAAAAAPAQVAEPGSGDASSPSPRPAAVEVAGGGRTALKGAGATGVRTSAWVGLSQRIRRGRGKRVASPRGQNQEGSRWRKRTDPRKKTETSAVKWGMVVGPNVRTWEGSAPGFRGTGKDLFTKQGREGSEVTRTQRRSSGNSRPSLLGGKAQRPYQVNRFPVFQLLRAPSLQLWEGLTASFPPALPKFKRRWNQEATRAKTS